MKKNLLTILLLALSVGLFAQSGGGDLQMKKNFWGVKFLQGDKLLRPGEVLDVMKNNQPAYDEFKKAKSNYDASQVFGAIGGFMIGWPLGTALGGGNPQWGLAAGGVGVLLLSIPFSNGFTTHARSAIDIYNNGKGTASTRPYSIHLIPHGTGAILCLRF